MFLVLIPFQMSRSEVFQEVTLEWTADAETKQWLWDETKNIDITNEETESDFKST
jgi:hypothetical protein